MTILSQYKSSLKRIETEELLDIWLYRPSAFILTIALVRTRVTPNQITAAAFASALVAAIALSTGTHTGMAIGAMFYVMSNVLDCCDGMVARIKRNGTVLGRMVDVFADCASGTAVYVGLGIGLGRAEVPWTVPIELLVVLAGLSFALQAALFDRARNRYTARIEGDRELIDGEIDDVTQLIVNAKGNASRVVLTGFASMYLRYMRWQRHGQPRGMQTTRRERLMLRLWSLLGSSTHVTVFALALLLELPELVFAYSIVVANAWMIALSVIERTSRGDTMNAKRASNNVVAVILAAGVGSRLRPLTDELPKPLVEVNGRPLLGWLLDGLTANGVNRIVIVVGHRSNVIEEFVDEVYGDVDIELVYNNDYRTSNNAASLLRASGAVNGNPMLLLDGDLFIEPSIIADALKSQQSCVVVRRSSDLGEEEVKVQMGGGNVVCRIGKDVETRDSIGESIGVAYFDANVSQRLFRTLRERVDYQHRRNEYYEASFQQMIDGGVAIAMLDAGDRTCIEIDTIQDLMDAEHLSRHALEYA